jgi:hypothetical protein
MKHYTNYRTASPATALLITVLALVLAGCATGSGVRSWVDERTAVAVTAQKRAWVFYRDDFQAGVNIHDFADLGALEINQSGKRRQYLCLQVWSTITRPTASQSGIDEDFSTLEVWADDQPLSFKRHTESHEMLHLGDVPFKRSSSGASEGYYEISPAQLATLAGAKTLRIAPANLTPGEALYHTWRDEHGSLLTFSNEISGTAKLINPETK